MYTLQTDLFGFDFRGPASSEALNQFLETVRDDMGGLLTESAQLKTKTTLLANQTLKQTLAMSRKLAAVSARDSGSNCKADLSDSTVLLTTDRDEATIASDSRLVHHQQYPLIMPPVTSVNWLSRTDGGLRYVADGVTTAVEVVYESGTVSYIPTEFAIAGDISLFFERILSSPSVLAQNPEISVFFSIPPTTLGTGYPNSNYLSFFPFPLMTTSAKVYYTTDNEPTLSIAGATWNDWPSYIDSLNHGGTYKTEVSAVYSSFPTTEITAVRFDLKQPFYLTESNDYIYSYGLGCVEVGLVKPTIDISLGTIRIDKPSGNFTTITDTHVTLANIAIADEAAVLSTYSWIDSGDATIAYVEITLDATAITDGQVPIITEVSVDYI